MRIEDKAHRYAWDKTCEYFNRHDGYLSGYQLEIQQLIKNAWIDGHKR